MSVHLRSRVGPSPTFAYFRVESALISRPAWAAPAWLAANAQTWNQRAFGVGASLAAAAWSLPLPTLQDRTQAVRLAWAGLRDVSEDRVILLGEAWYQAHMKGAVTAAGRRLLQRARDAGDRVILVSESIAPIITLLAEDLGADGVLCNRLEWRNGRATGRLLDPMVTAYAVDQVREHAASHGVDLSKCAAYGATEADAVLLGAVGRPCAVRPDAGLRRVARDMSWPIVVDGGE